jgi:hypothetical protein
MHKRRALPPLVFFIEQKKKNTGQSTFRLPSHNTILNTLLFTDAM